MSTVIGVGDTTFVLGVCLTSCSCWGGFSDRDSIIVSLIRIVPRTLEKDGRGWWETCGRGRSGGRRLRGFRRKGPIVIRN